MTLKAFIHKDNQEYPDNYLMKIEFVSGEKKELELASHKTIDRISIPDPNGPFFHDSDRKNGFRFEPHPNPIIEYVTKDDEWGFFPSSSIQNVTFDKRYSKIISIREKEISKSQKKVNGENQT